MYLVLILCEVPVSKSKCWNVHQTFVKENPWQPLVSEEGRNIAGSLPTLSQPFFLGELNLSLLPQPVGMRGRAQTRGGQEHRG